MLPRQPSQVAISVPMSAPALSASSSPPNPVMSAVRAAALSVLLALASEPSQNEQDPVGVGGDGRPDDPCGHPATVATPRADRGGVRGAG